MENQDTIEFNRKPGGIYSGRVAGKAAVFGAVVIAAIVAAAVILVAIG